MSLLCEAYVGNSKGIDQILKEDKDASVNDTDAYGDSALHAAAVKGQYLTVKKLIETYKANVNIKNSAGSTPLHKAAISGHLGVAKLLIENGADTELLNDAQKRAEDYANNKEIRMILKGDRLQTKEISVPKDKHGLIIGRGGSTLKRISRDTGVEINVPKQQNKKDTITLSGDEDEIAKAEAIIMKMLKREGLKSKPSLADIPEGWTASEIIIDPRKYGLIIGPKGRTIQNIIDKTGDYFRIFFI
eukprot:TRINITY_DN911_c0_g1_i2.p2 TRINITY_DN911_c0_g1~~TRINITY_DN911_c0_g1_i2.p2  ORF type:complete len:246 (+),score=60.00 TRINITY_DN911_c0_g1_i2:42-779(+)